jgi:hypothetical protein
MRNETNQLKDLSMGRSEGVVSFGWYVGTKNNMRLNAVIVEFCLKKRQCFGGDFV